MLALAAVLVVILAVWALLGIPYWRAYRKDLRAQSDWWAEWKRTDRPTKRRIRRALARGETLYHPDEARLSLGLSRWTDRVEAVGGWRLRIEWPLLGVGAIAALAFGDARLAVQLAVILASLAFMRGFVVPRLRRRRQQAVSANRRILGE